MKIYKKEKRLLLLMAALGGPGRRPLNRRLLDTVPGYPRRFLDGMRVLRRDLRDLASAGLLPSAEKPVPPQERMALELLGPLAERSRRFPFRDSVLAAWRRVKTVAGIHPSGGFPPATVVSLGGDWPAKVEFLHRAVKERRPLSFKYSRPQVRRGTKAHQVRPYGLGLRDGFWYLVAEDRDRSGIATFRLSRMGRVTLGSGSYEIPPGFDVRDALLAPAWTFGKKKYSASLRARGEAVLALKALPPGLRTLIPAEAGVARSHLAYANPAELARWLLPFGNLVRVQGPKSLQRILRDEAAKVLGQG